MSPDDWLTEFYIKLERPVTAIAGVCGYPIGGTDLDNVVSRAVHRELLRLDHGCRMVQELVTP